MSPCPAPVTCAYCSAHLPAERVALGYTYCTAKSCAKRGFVPKTFVAVCMPKSTFLVVGAVTDETMALGTGGQIGARR